MCQPRWPQKQAKAQLFAYRILLTWAQPQVSTSHVHSAIHVGFSGPKIQSPKDAWEKDLWGQKNSSPIIHRITLCNLMKWERSGSRYNSFATGFCNKLVFCGWATAYWYQFCQWCLHTWTTLSLSGGKKKKGTLLLPLKTATSAKTKKLHRLSLSGFR